MKKPLIFLLSILFLNFGGGLRAQKLSRTEKKIVAKVNSYEQEAIDFLEKVVNINIILLTLKGCLWLIMSTC